MGAAMNYTIKAIPTTYAGVRFRSRLEARWAAFFDLCGWSWDYEPIDLDGWAPDFILKFPIADIYVEVKPVETVESRGVWSFPDLTPWMKASQHGAKIFVLSLGARPQSPAAIGIGPLSDGFGSIDWGDVKNAIFVADPKAIWAEAGNLVQWRKG